MYIFSNSTVPIFCSNLYILYQLLVNHRHHHILCDLFPFLFQINIPLALYVFLIIIINNTFFSLLFFVIRKLKATKNVCISTG